MNADRRASVKENAATKQAPTPEFTVGRPSDTPQGRRIYLVRGVRRRPAGPETCSDFRRTRPAAERLAAEWVDLGRGPVTIHSAYVRDWRPEPFDNPHGWWVQ